MDAFGWARIARGPRGTLPNKRAFRSWRAIWVAESAREETFKPASSDANYRESLPKSTIFGNQLYRVHSLPSEKFSAKLGSYKYRVSPTYLAG